MTKYFSAFLSVMEMISQNFDSDHCRSDIDKYSKRRQSTIAQTALPAVCVKSATIV